MRTRHLVDEDLLPLIDSFAPIELSARTLHAVRDMAAQAIAAQSLPDLPVVCTEVQVPSIDAGRDLRCLLVKPAQAARDAPAILHFHGGGHVIGAPEMDLAQLMRWAADMECLVVSVDYRLAPESPFPGPMNDAYAALRWLHQQAGELGIDPARIAVAGSSAGGAMAACLCLMARDRGECPIAFQLLEAPRLDDRIQRQGSANRFTGEFVWTRDASAFCWSAYMGAGEPSPYASAARADDLSGLPPAFVSVGALDLFVDECLTYCGRLIGSGVPAELIVYPGCFHGFQMAGEAAVTKRAHQDSLRALGRALKR